MTVNVNTVLQERIVLILELALVLNVVQAMERMWVKMDVSLVLQGFSLMVANVNNVLLEPFLLVLELCNVKTVLVVINPVVMDKRVCLVEMDNFLNLEEPVNLVLLKCIPSVQAHANVMLVDQDLNQMERKMDVLNVQQANIRLAMIDVNNVHPDSFLLHLEPQNVFRVVVDEKLILQELRVYYVPQDRSLLIMDNVNAVRFWNTPLMLALANVLLVDQGLKWILILARLLVLLVNLERIHLMKALVKLVLPENMLVVLEPLLVLIVVVD